MTSVYKTYDISFFENTLWNGFQFEVPDSAMNIISKLAEQVGAPNYVKTPIFTKSNNTTSNTLVQMMAKNVLLKKIRLNCLVIYLPQQAAIHFVQNFMQSWSSN